MTVDVSQKILPYKTYFKIGHLLKSRLGPSDKHVDQGTNDNLTKELPNQQSCVIVQEKLDGSNVSVAKHKGKLYALGRSGYDCAQSNQEQHRMFHQYMLDNLTHLNVYLKDGDHIVGEWLALAHGTLYPGLVFPFWGLDYFKQNKRQSILVAYQFFSFVRIPTPGILHIGGACTPERAQRIMEKRHPGRDYEGFVYRLEEAGECKSIAKYVRPGKEDGKYLVDNKNNPSFEPIWNWAGACKSMQSDESTDDRTCWD